MFSSSLHVVTQSYPKNHYLNKPEYILPEDALTQISIFQANWFLRKILKIFFCIYVYVNFCPSPLCMFWPYPTISIRRNFSWICSDKLFNFSSTLHSEKKIFQYLFFCISLYKNTTPIVAPPYPTPWHLPYQRMLTHKFQLSWLITFLKDL